MLELKEYQQRSLDTLESYLCKVNQHGAKTAFVLETSLPYRSVPQLPGLPYVCLRVPTGGGKTFMACHALGIATTEFLHASTSVCLWLVPSTTIRDQTLAALRNRQHPYRQAIDARFGGNVTILNLAESLYTKPPTLSGDTCIIVSTLAALRVEETEGRKIYEQAGALMDHFSGLKPEQEALLEKNGEEFVPQSLCNALRLHRPLVIMDEAHNARTQLSFDTLARFNPSCIIEFTATPETNHKPEKGFFASNVLHHVSAAELKAEEMIKLPIRLETRPAWKEVLGDALKKQRSLEALALEEEKLTGEYIRPIVLIQAQPKNKDKETLTVEVLKQTLLDDFKVPEEHIAIATGQTREIDDVDLFSRECPIRFIITVAALKEGWDCSFAYVLCSVAELGSSRAVEQILGRVLRLPRAVSKQHHELNCAYAFAASPRFIEAANSLKDAMVQNGFERLEAELFVTPEDQPVSAPGGGAMFYPVPEKPDLTKLPENLKNSITYDEPNGTLTFTQRLDDHARTALAECFATPEGKKAVFSIAAEPRYKSNIPASRSITLPSFKIPMLAIRVDGHLEMFEESHFLDTIWKLSECDTELSEKDFPSEYLSGQVGELDITDKGTVELRFVEQVHRQVNLIGMESGWDIAGLTNWLDRQIQHLDIVRVESTLFIRRILTDLIKSRNLTIEQLAALKFRLRTAIANLFDKHRKTASRTAYQKLLFSEITEIEVSPEICFSFTEGQYAPNWYYEGSYSFKKPFFPMIGELKSEGEEYECAVYLDELPEVKYWVRNLERRPRDSFWLQTSTDKFYPDFVAMLQDGRILVVEYKGEYLWSNDDSKEKRDLGELWADRSNGSCLFVMLTDKNWEEIKDAVASSS